MDRKRKIALLCVAGGDIIFGFSFLFSRLALEITVPCVLLAARFTAAFIVLNILVLIGRNMKTDMLSFSLKGKPIGQLIILAMFQPCIYFICENYGILYTSTAFSGTIIAMVPIMGIILDVLIMKTKVGKKQIICAAVSVIGVAVTTLGAEFSGSFKGTVLLFGAVLAAGLFFVFSKKSGANFNALEQTYVMFGVGSVVYIVIALIQCDVPEIAASMGHGVFWLAVVYLAVLSSVTAFMLINYGTRFVSVSESSLLVNLTTIIAILAGVIFLKESFTIQQIIGAVMILVSVYVSSVGDKKE